MRSWGSACGSSGKKVNSRDGVVTVFDENDGMHHVQYDDNEQK